MQGIGHPGPPGSKPLDMEENTKTLHGPDSGSVIYTQEGNSTGS